MEHLTIDHSLSSKVLNDPTGNDGKTSKESNDFTIDNIDTSKKPNNSTVDNYPGDISKEQAASCIINHDSLEDKTYPAIANNPSDISKKMDDLLTIYHMDSSKLLNDPAIDDSETSKEKVDFTLDNGNTSKNPNDSTVDNYLGDISKEQAASFLINHDSLEEKTYPAIPNNPSDISKLIDDLLTIGHRESPKVLNDPTIDDSETSKASSDFTLDNSDTLKKPNDSTVDNYPGDISKEQAASSIINHGSFEEKTYPAIPNNPSDISKIIDDLLTIGHRESPKLLNDPIIDDSETSKASSDFALDNSNTSMKPNDSTADNINISKEQAASSIINHDSLEEKTYPAIANNPSDISKKMDDLLTIYHMDSSKVLNDPTIDDDGETSKESIDFTLDNSDTSKKPNDSTVDNINISKEQAASSIINHDSLEEKTYPAIANNPSDISKKPNDSTADNINISKEQVASSIINHDSLEEKTYPAIANNPSDISKKMDDLLIIGHRESPKVLNDPTIDDDGETSKESIDFTFDNSDTSKKPNDSTVDNINISKESCDSTLDNDDITNIINAITSLKSNKLIKKYNLKDIRIKLEKIKMINTSHDHEQPRNISQLKSTLANPHLKTTDENARMKILEVKETSLRNMGTSATYQSTYVETTRKKEKEVCEPNVDLHQQTSCNFSISSEESSGKKQGIRRKNEDKSCQQTNSKRFCVQRLVSNDKQVTKSQAGQQEQSRRVLALNSVNDTSSSIIAPLTCERSVNKEYMSETRPKPANLLDSKGHCSTKEPETVKLPTLKENLMAHKSSLNIDVPDGSNILEKSKLPEMYSSRNLAEVMTEIMRNTLHTAVKNVRSNQHMASADGVDPKDPDHQEDFLGYKDCLCPAYKMCQNDCYISRWKIKHAKLSSALASVNDTSSSRTGPLKGHYRSKKPKTVILPSQLKRKRTYQRKHKRIKIVKETSLRNMETTETNPSASTSQQEVNLGLCFVKLPRLGCFADIFKCMDEQKLDKVSIPRIIYNSFINIDGHLLRLHPDLEINCTKLERETRYKRKYFSSSDDNSTCEDGSAVILAGRKRRKTKRNSKSQISKINKRNIRAVSTEGHITNTQIGQQEQSSRGLDLSSVNDTSSSGTAPLICEKPIDMESMSKTHPKSANLQDLKGHCISKEPETVKNIINVESTFENPHLKNTDENPIMKIVKEICHGIMGTSETYPYVETTGQEDVCKSNVELHLQGSKGHCSSKEPVIVTNIINVESTFENPHLKNTDENPRMKIVKEICHGIMGTSETYPYVETTGQEDVCNSNVELHLQDLKGHCSSKEAEPVMLPTQHDLEYKKTPFISAGARKWFPTP